MLPKLAAPARPDRRRARLPLHVRPGGLGYEEAARKLLLLVREARTREVTGVALKEGEGGRGSGALGTATSTPGPRAPTPAP